MKIFWQEIMNIALALYSHTIFINKKASFFFLFTYLIAVSLLFMFSSYRIEYRNQIWRTVGKIFCAGNW